LLLVELAGCADEIRAIDRQLAILKSEDLEADLLQAEEEAAT